MDQWRNKVAVVTGGGSGIGRALALGLAEEGLTVAVADVDVAAADETATLVRAGGGRAIAVPTDVRRRADLDRLAETTRTTLGEPFIVCANAGVFVGGALLDMTESDWRWLLDVNLMGVVYTAQAFAPGLSAQGAGHLLITASVGGFLSGGLTPIYSTTKFAVVAVAEALRMELAGAGVGVTCLCPGSTDTNLPDANRLRPDDWGPGRGDSQLLRPLIAMGTKAPAAIAADAIRGLRANAAYVFTHREYREIIGSRFAEVLKAFDDAT